MRVVRPRTLARLSLAVVALVSCSKSSTGPGDPVVGTWHVSVAAMNSAVFAPASFTLTMTASGSGYKATLPAMTYDTTHFDSAGSVQSQIGGDTTLAIGQLAMVHGDTVIGVRLSRGATADADCEYAALIGKFNAARDSIMGSVDIINRGQGGSGCNDYGAFIAVKQ